MKLIVCKDMCGDCYHLHAVPDDLLITRMDCEIIETKNGKDVYSFMPNQGKCSVEVIRCVRDLEDRPHIITVNSCEPKRIWGNIHKNNQIISPDDLYWMAKYGEHKFWMAISRLNKRSEYYRATQHQEELDRAEWGANLDVNS
jgi:hypothetical protein